MRRPGDEPGVLFELLRDQKAATYGEQDHVDVAARLCPICAMLLKPAPDRGGRTLGLRRRHGRIILLLFACGHGSAASINLAPRWLLRSRRRQRPSADTQVAHSEVTGTLA
jgi:hypothetical protein